MNTETLLLTQVKKIAVRVVHKTLHLQNLWKMIQSPEELVRVYVSRLVATAELCDLYVTCSKQGCDQKSSFRVQVLLQSLLRGMNVTDIRTRVLSRTQNDDLQGLTCCHCRLHCSWSGFLPLSLEYRSICAMIKFTIDAWMVERSSTYQFYFIIFH